MEFGSKLCKSPVYNKKNSVVVLGFSFLRKNELLAVAVKTVVSHDLLQYKGKSHFEKVCFAFI